MSVSVPSSWFVVVMCDVSPSVKEMKVLEVEAPDSESATRLALSPGRRTHITTTAQFPFPVMASEAQIRAVVDALQKKALETMDVPSDQKN